EPLDALLDVPQQQRAVRRLGLQAMNERFALGQRLPGVFDRAAPFFVSTRQLVELRRLPTQIRFQAMDRLFGRVAVARELGAARERGGRLLLQLADDLGVVVDATFELHGARLSAGKAIDLVVALGFEPPHARGTLAALAANYCEIAFELLD